MILQTFWESHIFPKLVFRISRFFQNFWSTWWFPLRFPDFLLRWSCIFLGIRAGTTSGILVPFAPVEATRTSGWFWDGYDIQYIYIYNVAILNTEYVVCACTHTHTHTHIYIHAYIRTYLLTYLHTYKYTCTNIYIYIYIHIIYIYIYTHTCRRTYMHACIDI